MDKYAITPVPKPRQTRAERWKQRPCVMRYRQFADQVRLEGIAINDKSSITFALPMPKSWSKKKKAEMDGQPHRQKPDIDNLAKALMDAIFPDDSILSTLACRKIWSESGYIEVGSHG